MKRILCRALIGCPSRKKSLHLACSGRPVLFPRKEKKRPYNCSYIDQAYSVKMAEIIGVVLLSRLYGPWLRRWKELDQYLAIFTPLLVNNTYLALTQYWSKESGVIVNMWTQQVLQCQSFVRGYQSQKVLMAFKPVQYILGQFPLSTSGCYMHY